MPSLEQIGPAVLCRAYFLSDDIWYLLVDYMRGYNASARYQSYHSCSLNSSTDPLVSVFHPPVYLRNDPNVTGPPLDQKGDERLTGESLEKIKAIARVAPKQLVSVGFRTATGNSSSTGPTIQGGIKINNEFERVERKTIQEINDRVRQDILGNLYLQVDEQRLVIRR